MKTHLFIPCFVDQLFPDTAFNVVKLLERVGCQVIYNENQTCCGQPAFNAGYWEDARSVCGKWLSDFADASTIVTPSASCAGFVRNYFPKLFDSSSLHHEAQATPKRIWELSEFLVKTMNATRFGATLNGKAAYHDSCAGLRECKIKQEPRALLQGVSGLELIELPDAETCCGFGGTFSVKYPDISVAMGQQKVEQALNAGAEYIISTDLSCLMHLQGYIQKNNLPLKTMHLADVLTSGW